MDSEGTENWSDLSPEELFDILTVKIVLPENDSLDAEEDEEFIDENDSSNLKNAFSPLIEPTNKVGLSLAEIDLGEQNVELIGGLFPRGKVSALIGESGKGKGWILAASALAFTDGKEFLPNDSYVPQNDGKVLIVDTEGRIGLWKQRVLELGGNLNNFRIPDQQYKISRFKSKLDREQIEAAIETYGIGLVIIDSFAGFSDADENTCGVLPTLKWFVDIALKFNVALVFTQLANKSETKDGKLTLKSVRGFGGIHQFPEIIWAIDTPNESDDKKKRLYQLKNNFGEKDRNDYIFILDNSTITFTGEVIESRTARIDKRKELLEANLGKLSSKELVELLCKAEPGLSTEAAKQYVSRYRKNKNVVKASS